MLFWQNVASPVAYPAYYDLSTKPVRKHPIPSYLEDPEEAVDHHSLAALDRLRHRQHEARRRIVTAIARRRSIESPPLVP
jgi:hypothetical protein